MAILLQIGKPGTETGELLYRCEVRTISGVATVIRTEWDDNGIPTVTQRPASDYEALILAEPDCPLVD